MSGPDIFLSYNREDSARAKHFADGFAAEGLTVWWDVALRSGEAYDEVTEAALSGAKAVVVLWSPRSVVSRWVRAEATEAERNKTLLPAMIEPCKRPIMFELVQTAELSHWHGDTADPAWQTFVGHVCSFIGKEAGPKAPAVPLAKSDQTSVVVLPFANMSNDPEQDYFADGISEDIITDLSKVSALMVIARNTAFTFKGKHVDIKDVARQLEVTHVLEGSVRKAGNRLRITAQLIDGATGGHLWAERYDRELADIFDIQDEISKAIVGALKVKLLPAERKAIENRLTNSAEAYDHYMRARGLRASMNVANIRKAVDAYRDALAIDPKFAMAWAGLASVRMQLRNMSEVVEDSTQEEIDEAFARAVELAPDIPDIMASRATRALGNFDWGEAERCIVFFQSRGDDNWSIVSHLLLALGRVNESVHQQFKVWRADPLSIGATWGLQYHLEFALRIDEAEEHFQRFAEVATPAFPMVWRAVERAMLRRDRAQLEERLLGNLDGFSTYMPFVRDLVKNLDQPDRALAILSRAEANVKAPLAANGIAHWAAYFGGIDLAISTLRRSAFQRTANLLYDAWHPDFRELRKDPRFKEMVADTGLPDHWRRTGNWGDFARPLGDGDFEIIG